MFLTAWFSVSAQVLQFWDISCLFICFISHLSFVQSSLLMTSYTNIICNSMTSEFIPFTATQFKVSCFNCWTGVLGPSLSLAGDQLSNQCPVHTVASCKAATYSLHISWSAASLCTVLHIAHFRLDSSPLVSLFFPSGVHCMAVLAKLCCGFHDQSIPNGFFSRHYGTHIWQVGLQPVNQVGWNENNMPINLSAPVHHSTPLRSVETHNLVVLFWFQ